MKSRINYAALITNIGKIKRNVVFTKFTHQRALDYINIIIKEY